MFWDVLFIIKVICLHHIRPTFTLLPCFCIEPDTAAQIVIDISFEYHPEFNITIYSDIINFIFCMGERYT